MLERGFVDRSPVCLIVEDNVPLSSALKRVIQKLSFSISVTHTVRGAEKLLDTRLFDIVVLDRVLPDGDGVNLLSYIREHFPQTRVIILSTKMSVMERIFGLQHGADDYLPKPFSEEELCARIKALMRRGIRKDDETISFGGCLLSLQKQQLTTPTKTFTMTPHETRFLQYMMQESTHRISKESLLSFVWPIEYRPMDSSLESLVSRLRKKLRGTIADIHTVRYFGYELMIKGDIHHS